MKNILASVITVLTMATATSAMAADYPEFGGRCALGVAMAKEFKTDCSVSWTTARGDQLCFGNEQAKTDFLKDTDNNLDKAFRNYDNIVMQKG